MGKVLRESFSFLFRKASFLDFKKIKLFDFVKKYFMISSLSQ